jgi:hypothetical protein
MLPVDVLVKFTINGAVPDVPLAVKSAAGAAGGGVGAGAAAATVM